MGFNEESCFLGIEAGSTRIKATLIDSDFMPVASGSYIWSDTFDGRHWTYSMADVWKGIAECYASLKEDVRKKQGAVLHSVKAIGISAMMHGYLAFDENGEQLAPFRTWRNTTTEESAEKLSALFSFNIPQRWSIAHLYQAMLDGEAHVKRISFLTTLSGYIHSRLTGRRVLGIGDASGMFPIDSGTGTYDERMVSLFQDLTDVDIRNIFPAVLSAGEDAGTLTEEGALLLDREGDLKSGIPLCPPEGDAGTGMTATNSVRERTGNVSAGTSIFSMVVLEKPLSSMHKEIDIVTTPDGKPVAMVHCNNCTSNMNSWVSLIKEAVSLMGGNADLDEIYSRLYRKSLEGSPDCNGMTIYNYVSGEPVTGFQEGVPLVITSPDKPLNLSDFVRAHLYSALVSLSYGMRILSSEGVQIDKLMGHGGLFRHHGVGDRYLAAAVSVPVYTMKTAGEGGPYGMALLAAYSAEGKGMPLPVFLEEKVFSKADVLKTKPCEEDEEGFRVYLERFLSLSPVERAAIGLM